MQERGVDSMITIDPETKAVLMDEDEYVALTGHIKDCENEINTLKMRMNMVESKCQT
jgi:hypothetical protein